MIVVLGVIVIANAVMLAFDLGDALVGQPADIQRDDNGGAPILTLVVVGGLLVVGGLTAAFVPFVRDHSKGFPVSAEAPD